MANTVDKVINILLEQVDYLEKSKFAYLKNPNILYEKTAGAGKDNYTKFGFEMHKIYPAVMDFPAAWCDSLIDWGFYIAYGVANAKSLLGGNFDDYTVASAKLYKDKKSWYTSNPQVGDQIFFKDSKGGICHTGLVYKVDANTVYTIEGNTSSAKGVVPNGGCVAKKSYSKTYSRIAGYGRPRYDVVESSPVPSVGKTYTVVNGDTLSGIGQKVGMNWRTIADLNGIKSPYIIKVGQVLKLTGKTETAIKPVLASGTPVLKKGSKGQQVIYLQTDLNKVVNANLVIDGDFGTNTEKAVKKFQSISALAQDGQYGPKSEAKMKIVL